MIPILQSRKLRYREVNWFFWGHTASKWWSQNVNSSHLTRIPALHSYPVLVKLSASERPRLLEESANSQTPLPRLLKANMRYIRFYCCWFQKGRKPDPRGRIPPHLKVIFGYKESFVCLSVKGDGPVQIHPCTLARLPASHRCEITRQVEHVVGQNEEHTRIRPWPYHHSVIIRPGILQPGWYPAGEGSFFPGGEGS